jgi:hypothetical protein
VEVEDGSDDGSLRTCSELCDRLWEELRWSDRRGEGKEGEEERRRGNRRGGEEAGKARIVVVVVRRSSSGSE